MNKSDTSDCLVMRIILKSVLMLDATHFLLVHANRDVLASELQRSFKQYMDKWWEVHACYFMESEKAKELLSIRLIKAVDTGIFSLSISTYLNNLDVNEDDPAVKANPMKRGELGLRYLRAEAEPHYSVEVHSPLKAT